MKIGKQILIILSFIFSLFVINSELISAKGLVVDRSFIDIFGSPIGQIEIYDNSQIIINYKYGLRKAVLKYCIKGEECDGGYYNEVVIMEATQSEPYKNNSDTFGVYKYKFDAVSEIEYRYRVIAYVGISSSYQGNESLASLPQCSVDTGDIYINGSNASNVGNKHISTLLEDIKEIINFIVLPVLYVALGLLLVIKGAILGVQIVKSADEPQVRQEKIGALKWLVIGVAISYAASIVVGVLTGFFESFF